MKNSEELDQELVGLYDEIDSYVDMLKNDNAIDLDTGELADGSTIASLLSDDAERVSEILKLYEDNEPDTYYDDITAEYYFLLDRINKLNDAINNKVDFIEEDGSIKKSDACAMEIAGDAMRVAEIDRTLKAMDNVE